MQAKRRYLLVAGSFTIAVWFYLVFPVSERSVENGASLAQRSLHRRSFLQVAGDLDVFGNENDHHPSAKQRRGAQRSTFNNSLCRMENCFDVSLCRDGFKVYVYPPLADTPPSVRYSEILSALNRSRYRTDDPTEACVFIPSIDTLDRDKLSPEFVKNIQYKISSLPYWNGGQNHILFNLYPGTWPDYEETDLGFDTGKAILAKASVSETYYRSEFDISFPLFDKQHSATGGESGYLTGNNFPPLRKYTLVFKGKRYLTGIGSETRNSLYHIHNGEDIILLTTCKHGKGWKNLEDSRCEQDNEDYEKYDYKVMLHNSTFCLVPRGRRLGSYRFLEALQAGCVPVILSNNWVLPFSEVIDWNQAAVWADERLLLQVPSIVRSIGYTDILALRQQTQFLWDSYFSSIDKIVATSLEIVKERVNAKLAYNRRIWNSLPGGLMVLPEYSLSSQHFPFGWHDRTATSHFTAVIYATSSAVMASSPLYRLVKNIGKSQYVHKVLVLWHCTAPPPVDVRWSVPSHVSVVIITVQSIGERFHPYSEIETDVVLSLDEDATIIPDEMDFGFGVWQHFPDRIVGYPARGHHWDENMSSWAYSSKWSNHYSMVLTSAAFYHRYYGYLYENWLEKSVHDLVHELQNCEDILFNMLVAHTIKLPPIKVGQRHFYKETLVTGSERTSPWMNPDHFRQRHYCLEKFADHFGYMPLRRSEVRLDPHLYKDHVSVKRKKYPKMESIS